MKELSVISGTVKKEASNNNPVIVGLAAEKFRRDHVTNVKTIDTEEFELGTKPGNIYVFAFEDENRDLAYQEGEPAGYHGKPKPTPIELRSGGEEVEVEIELSRKTKFSTSDSKDGNLPKLWVGRKNIGEAASLEDPRFSRKYATMGTWQPVQYSLNIGPGLFLLEPYDPGKIPVLFVHGMNGTPRDFGEIIKNLDRTRYQPWILAYASGLALERNVRYLRQALTHLRFKYKFESLFLVAHSMGGLVSKGFIDSIHRGNNHYLKLFVTVSTPWAGHNSAATGVKMVSEARQVPVWRDMAPDSDFIIKVRRNDLPEGLPHHLLFSYRGGGFFRREAKDGVVTVVSQLDWATQERATRIYGFHSTHTGILADKNAIRILNSILDDARARLGR